MRIHDRIQAAFRGNPDKAGRRLLSLRTGTLFGLLLVGVLVISACGKVPMPESDDSPPSVSWRVIDGLTSAPAPVRTSIETGISEATVGEMTIIALEARDAEGVQRIKLSEPVVSYVCVTESGETVPDVGGDQKLVLDSQEETIGPDAEGYVFEHLLLMDTVYFNYDCGDGLYLAEAAATFYAEAENYFGAVSPGELTIIYTP